MNKFILAGASALAILVASGAANAQETTPPTETPPTEMPPPGGPIGIGIDLSVLLEQVQADADGFGGVYINAAVSNALVDGSVDISASGITDDLNIASGTFTLESSSATADATASLDSSIDGETGTISAAGTAAGDAAQIALAVVGTSIETGELATTAIGAVNDGTIALSALTAEARGASFDQEVDGGFLDLASSASNSAANTSSTAASAAASALALSFDGGFSDTSFGFEEAVVSGPAAIVAANLAVQNAVVDGSVTVSGATQTVVGATDTTAIGAVNTGTISNGLPGSITITVD